VIWLKLLFNQKLFKGLNAADLNPQEFDKYLIINESRSPTTTTAPQNMATQ